MKKNPRVDAYIKQAAPFAQPILRHLRKLVGQGCPEAEETIKWGMPSFEYLGLMCGMAAFKQHCTFGFWKNARLIDDPSFKPGAMGHLGRITALSDLPDDATLLRLIRRAAELNRSGEKVARAPRANKPPPKAPPDLAAALKKNSAARKTYEAFSPSNQREYVEWITEAKTAETRARRLATALEWMAEGKVRNWKYLNC